VREKGEGDKVRAQKASRTDVPLGKEKGGPLEGGNQKSEAGPYPFQRGGETDTLSL